MKQFIADIMDSRDVMIYADKDPVMRTSRLTLGGHSSLLASLLRSLSVCDGCDATVAIIIADEDRDTVRAALSKVVSVSGVTVIKGNVIVIRIQIFVKPKSQTLRPNPSQVNLELK